MSETNESKLQVESDVTVDKEFFLEHTRLVPAKKDSNIRLDLTVGGEDGFEFTIVLVFKSDPHEASPQIKYNTDPETNTINVTLINWCYPYYDSMNSVSTKKIKIADIDDKEIFIDLMLFFVKDSDESTLVVFNMYSK
jgi:hypothetical protein